MGEKTFPSVNSHIEGRKDKFLFVCMCLSFRVFFWFCGGTNFWQAAFACACVVPGRLVICTREDGEEREGKLMTVGGYLCRGTVVLEGKLCW